MNPKAFFDYARAHLFTRQLTSGQVQGINAILSAWDKFGDGNAERLAYLLATAKHETADTMQPIHEYGNKAYFAKYDPGTKLGKGLGNSDPGDGYRFRGRGFVQLTGRANYNRVSTYIGENLINDPDKALQPDIAARILVEGSLKGWFTGKGLALFIDDIDEADDQDVKEFLAARRVINGSDKAARIAAFALEFEKALKA